MRKVLAAIFRYIAKSIAVLFAILFVLVSILVLPLFNIEHTLLDPGTYKRALAENGVYQQLPALAAEEMEMMKPFLAKPIGDKGMTFINNLPIKDRQTLFALLLPPDEARVMVENMLDQVFAYINGETDTARLSIVALKAHLTGQAGEDLILLLLNAQLPCTEEQLIKIFAGNAGDTGQLVYCSPPQEVLAPVTSLLHAHLASIVAGIPDEVDIIKPPSKLAPPSEGPLGSATISTLNRIRMGIRFSPLLSLSLLILVTLFGIRSLKGWLRWWGIPLFITGLIVIIISVVILPVLDWAWVIYVIPRFPSTFSTGITDLARGMAGSVAGTLANQIMLEAAIIGLLGLAAIIGSFFVESKFKEPASLASTH